MHAHDLPQQLADVGARVRERTHAAADSATDGAQGLLQRSRALGARWREGDYRRQLSHAAEDLADQANYRYRRARRQIERHPLATATVVAGTLAAFLLLRRALRSDGRD